MRILRNRMFPFSEGLPRSVDRCKLSVDADRPWLGELIHRVDIDAPKSADPLCCYIDTVIFYEVPHRVVPGGGWAEHGRAQLPIRLDDEIEAPTGLWLVQAGRLRWDERTGWEMVWRLRRIGEAVV